MGRWMRVCRKENVPSESINPDPVAHHIAQNINIFLLLSLGCATYTNILNYRHTVPNILAAYYLRRDRQACGVCVCVYSRAGPLYTLPPFRLSLT